MGHGRTFILGTSFGASASDSRSRAESGGVETASVPIASVRMLDVSFIVMISLWE